MFASDDIEYIDCEQGSEDWHRARAGCITASKVRDIRDLLKSGPDKGEFSKKAKDHAFKLAIERITHLPIDDDEFSPWQGARGQRLEPVARERHEIVAGVVVQPMGFIRTKDGKFGVSVDGLIGDDEGSEYKAFLAPSKLRAFIADGNWDDVKDQCQFGLGLTGRKRWHACLYCPQLEIIGRDLTIKIFERDEIWIDSMWQDLLRFDRLVEHYRTRLLERPGDVAAALNAAPAAPAPVAALLRAPAAPASAATLEPTF